MQEIVLKANNTGLKVFIDEEPDLSSMNEKELDILATALEMVISKQFETYVKRKSQPARKRKDLEKTGKSKKMSRNTDT